MPKKSVSEHLWRVNMVKDPKHYLNMHGRILVIFFDHSEIESAQIFMFS